MARFTTFLVAVLLAAATIFIAPVLAGQDDGQRRAPKASTPQQAQPRKPPAQKPPAQKPSGQKPPAPRRAPPNRPAPRPPSASQPPTQHAVPRPPVSRRPHVVPGDRTWVYPIYPPFTFDLIYGFPYGLYPYWTYGDPWGLYYTYPAPLPEYPPEAPEAVACASLRFDVPERDAAVFVDGYYVGVVDDFTVDKMPLDVEAGAHRIEIRKPGFETLLFFVNPDPGQVITYRGVLQPVRP